MKTLKELQKSANKFFRDSNKKVLQARGKKYVFTDGKYTDFTNDLRGEKLLGGEVIFECKIEMKVIIRPYKWKTNPDLLFENK